MQKNLPNYLEVSEKVFIFAPDKNQESINVKQQIKANDYENRRNQGTLQSV